jgi:beta-lactamase class D
MKHISTRAFAIAIITLLQGVDSAALTESEFKKEFADRDACFLISDLKNGKIISEHNSKRCKEQFSPCSSFKIAAALMAFEKGVFKDESHPIKWDGIKRGRIEIDKDLTPYSWMSTSAIWVTSWIMPQLGKEALHGFLETFSYGNRDFSGPRKEPWQTSSLKISAHEQLAFISKFWKGELPLTKNTIERTKNIIFVKDLGIKSKLYGKTGTGCLQGTSCMDKPDKMIGWFVGVLKNGDSEYVFAANASDLVPQGTPAGPRTRDTVIQLLKKMGFAK